MGKAITRLQIEKESKMKNKALLILSILMATCFFASVAAAQSGGNYAITQSVIAGGGGSSSGSTYSVTGTAGQPAAGTLSSGGNYSLAGGFWSAAPVGTIVISGRVTTDGTTGLQGVTVSLSGSATGSTTTDVNGNYQFVNLLSGGSFTVTPSLAGYVFNPPSATFLNATSDQTANFIATQCTYVLMPTSANVGAAASAASFTVTAPAGCPWTATANDGWLAVTSGSPGSGNGTVNYSVAANSGAQRIGTISAGGQTFTVTQAIGHSISGTIAYGTGSGKFVPGVTLTAVGPNTINTTSVFSPAGNYLLAGLTDGAGYTVTPTKTTHVNGITAFDATLVLRCVAAGGGCVLTTNQRRAADSDGDSGVTAFDATQILRYVAANGANANTGQAGTWKFDPVNRSYPGLVTNPTGQDYTAFLIGDVDGDWTQPSSLAEETVWQSEKDSFSVPAEADDAQSVLVSLPSGYSATKSQIVLIPVLLSNKTGRDISSFAAEVAFDPAVLQIDKDNPIQLSGTLGESGKFTVAFDTATEGRIGIAGGGGSLFASPEGTLVNLRFKIVGDKRLSKKGMNLMITRALFQDQDGLQITAKSPRHKLSVSEEAP